MLYSFFFKNYTTPKGLCFGFYKQLLAFSLKRRKYTESNEVVQLKKL